MQKPRRVAAIIQRKSDGAVVVAKLHKLKGKENKIGKDYIPGLVLKPENHISLDKETIVGRETVMGFKQTDKTFKPILTRDLEDTGDKLTRKELRKIKRGVHNDKKQHRKTYRRKLRKWRRRNFK